VSARLCVRGPGSDLEIQRDREHHLSRDTAVVSSFEDTIATGTRERAYSDLGRALQAHDEI
jgi:hypothetical protein